MTDEEIETAVAADPDGPRLGDRERLEGATRVVPDAMEAARSYLDKDVVAWFPARNAEVNWHGNRALREYADVQGAKLENRRPAHRPKKASAG